MHFVSLAASLTFCPFLPIRVVKNNENEVFVDLTGKANGRGAYIKKDIDVLNKARKSKVLDKHLETTIDDSVYEKLEEIINQ